MLVRVAQIVFKQCTIIHTGDAARQANKERPFYIPSKQKLQHDRTYLSRRDLCRLN